MVRFADVLFRYLQFMQLWPFHFIRLSSLLVRFPLLSRQGWWQTASAIGCCDVVTSYGDRGDKEKEKWRFIRKGHKRGKLKAWKVWRTWGSTIQLNNKTFIRGEVNDGMEGEMYDATIHEGRLSYRETTQQPLTQFQGSGFRFTHFSYELSQSQFEGGNRWQRTCWNLLSFRIFKGFQPNFSSSRFCFYWAINLIPECTFKELSSS